MKKISYIGAFFFLLSIVIFVTPKAVLADTVCTPIYGGGQQCVTNQLSLDKKVKNPSTGVYVDNLSPSDPKYAPGATVSYEISVTNTGNTNFGTVTVTDTLPDFVDFVSGSGSYNPSNRQLTYVINNLNAGATDRQVFNVKVYASANLPNKNTLCDPEFNLTNRAKAKADSAEASDESRFCIQKQVQGVTTVPKAGAEEWILAMLGISMIAGFGLNKGLLKIKI